LKPKLVAVVWVADGHQAAGAFVEAGPALRGYTVFANHMIEGVVKVTTPPGFRVERMRQRPLLVVECGHQTLCPR